MSGTNLSYVFYKQYYDGLADNTFEDRVRKCNKILSDREFCRDDVMLSGQSLYNESIDLYVNYPGLLTGMGIIHETGLSKEEIKTGFSFDYVTGMPYIPASGVKGALRRAFRVGNGVYVKDSLGLSQEEVTELERKVFGSSAETGEGKGDDCFLDAWIVSGNADNKILGMDNIAPHKKITREPVPVNMIKLLPGVRLRFCFILSETVLNTGRKVTEGEKSDLFKKILVDFGLGAKTNTGYGVLTPDDPESGQRGENQNDGRDFIRSNDMMHEVDTDKKYKVTVKEKPGAQRVKLIFISKSNNRYYPEIAKTQIYKDNTAFPCNLRKVFKKGDELTVRFIEGEEKAAALEYNDQTPEIRNHMDLEAEQKQ